MSGIIAWLTGFLVGNDDGKQMCAATMYRPYMYQAGMCAGVGIDTVPRDHLPMRGQDASRGLLAMSITSGVLRGASRTYEWLRGDR